MVVQPCTRNPSTPRSLPSGGVVVLGVRQDAPGAGTSEDTDEDPDLVRVRLLELLPRSRTRGPLCRRAMGSTFMSSLTQRCGVLPSPACCSTGCGRQSSTPYRAGVAGAVGQAVRWEAEVAGGGRQVAGEQGHAGGGGKAALLQAAQRHLPCGSGTGGGSSYCVLQQQQQNGALGREIDCTVYLQRYGWAAIACGDSLGCETA